MVSYQFDIAGERQVDRMLSRSTEKIRDLRPFLDAAGNLLRQIMGEQFSSEGSRGGEPWAPLSSRYSAYKLSRWGQQPILVASRAMRESLTDPGGSHIERRPERDTLEFGTRVPYAVYHQTGTERMPQRKILDLVERDRRNLMKLLQQHLFTNRSMAGFAGRL